MKTMPFFISFHVQRNRRNMSDDDILRCLQLHDTIHATAQNDKILDSQELTRIREDNWQDVSQEKARFYYDNLN